MKLEERLRLLRGDAVPAAATSGDLAERLRRLTPMTGERKIREQPDEQTLAEAIGAVRLSPGVLRAERRIRLADRHGRMVLNDALPGLPALLDRSAGDPAAWLFLDTETSGLAGGTGTWAFLCGLARIEGQALVLRQYLLARLDAEPAYLDAIGGELASAELLVTYNGKSFDVPLLTTRFRLAGMESMLDLKEHLDLLVPVRRAFGRVWPDCRLTTAESRLLGFVRKGDLPGAQAPQAWLAWLRRGETERLAAVLLHNRWDLLSLPALVPALEWSFRDPAAAGAEIRAVARHHLARGANERAFQLLGANREALSASALLDLARLHGRRGEWDAALQIWQALAEKYNPKATEALAKYLEHRARDYRRALVMARRLPLGPERERRCRRLQARIWSRETGAPAYPG
ncbi:MAG: ribonuclease H-like domain-containing protein [Pseudomonadota bacterium]|nr:ribonuclease H-like domain-containing protein [Pseudomonadota bacterium]